ncbi:MAG TPA: 3-deoxy-D-manno-octulosonic acid transferase [Pyrinomonadaceae bacterium]|nr:3-deoxy-D-manno-octulosonic acid transferase [Pyrinomonadaceae bacterium]
MYLVYSLLLGLGFLILLPRFVIDAFRHGKYVTGFRERIGSVSPIQDRSRPVIWLHCVSVGETQAARPLIKAIKNRFPNHSVVVSTITTTGQQLAHRIFKNEVAKVFYFPFDWKWVVRRTLASVNPAAVLLMETEIWPVFLRECERQQIPVAIVNGRLSDQSFRRYRMIKGFMKRVLSSVDVAVMQTEMDAKRLGALGMSVSRTHVAGNIKFDAGALPGGASLATTFNNRFGLDNAPIILAASTHANEERLILSAFREMPEGKTVRPRLIIAPRHPERFNEVASLLAASEFTWSRRSSPESPADTKCEIILLDSIGELNALYSLATIVFVGGSIARKGGHNIVEPAAVGACVVTGPHTNNFRQIVNTFVESDAIVQLPHQPDPLLAERLSKLLAELLANPSRRQELSEKAKELVKENLGAASRTVDLVAPLLNGSNR